MQRDEIHIRSKLRWFRAREWECGSELSQSLKKLVQPIVKVLGRFQVHIFLKCGDI